MTTGHIVHGGYPDSWLQPDALLQMEQPVGTVTLTFYLPKRADRGDPKLVSVTDGRTSVTAEVFRGQLTTIAFPTLPSETSILRVLSRDSEQSTEEDKRQLGVVLSGVHSNEDDLELTFSLETEDVNNLESTIDYPGCFAVSASIDPVFYNAQFPTNLAPHEPVTDYVAFGWREGLNPNENFDTAFYLGQVPELTDRNICPIIHFQEEGRRLGLAVNAQDSKQKSEERRPAGNLAGSDDTVVIDLITALQTPLIFDFEYFKNKYAVHGDSASIVADYLRDPMRQASPYFDPIYYGDCHLEGKSTGLEALHHYLNIGRNSGFRPASIFDGTAVDISVEQITKLIEQSGLFDPDYYKYKNGDVARAGADPLRHYARVGNSEYKRAPNALFNNNYYISQAVDVRIYKWHPLVHYLMIGAAKGFSPHPMVDVDWISKALAGDRQPPDKTLLSRLISGDTKRHIGPNELFDPAYYESLEPDAATFPGGPVAHYIEVGSKKLTDPSRLFSAAGYSRANPDVAGKGVDPLLHYLTNGRAEGRNPKPSQTSVPVGLERFGPPEYGATGPALNFDAETVLPHNFALSVAVHLHLFYVEMADEFCSRFEFIPVPFCLFVSVPPGRGDAAAIRTLFQNRLRNCLNVVVVMPENRGRDVAPFVVELGRELLKFDLVLHLHTKRSPHSPKHADWRRYLLHYTLGNTAIVTQILTAFHTDPKIGIFQPPYHPQVQAQPKWGSNRNKVTEWLPRLGLSYAGDSCPDFPAGSFFWARTDALRPMLDGHISLQDFDEEASQIDSTLAHAIERLFGLVPVLRGYSVVSRFIDVAHNLVNYYGKSRVFDAFHWERNRDIADYQTAVQRRKGKRGRIAVVTAISGPFDALLLPELLEADIDYFCMTDTITDGYGVFRLLPLPYLDADPRRSARYVKTNLLRLFPGYEVVVWIDANVLARSPISKFVAATEAAGCCVGAIPHPTRRSYLEEADVAVEMALDDAEIIATQLERYARVEGLEEANLIETNFMVFDARRPQTAEFTLLWWNQINTYSRRDQLSINYCLLQAGANWYPLLPEFTSTRDSPSFTLFRHGLNQWGPKPHIYASWHMPHSQDGHLTPLPEIDGWSRHAGRLDLDVVVCVHNALDDVRLCLASLDSALQGRGRIILVDDASDAQTASFLDEAATGENVTLIRHEGRLGYTKAANAGVRAGNGRNVVLLNSDTIVPPGALDKLSDALDRHLALGIVGPLSNAASFQSVPSTAGTASQTAINQLPSGMSVADMDLFLERRWEGAIVRTPLVHGFCFCVKRAVFDQIGLFDEEGFPKGYGEENDFCFRAGDAGYDLGVLTSTYVFHAKSKSYAEGERTVLMEEGMASLIRKVTKPRITRAVETMQKQPALAAAQQAVAALFTRPEPVSATPRGRLFLLPSLRSDGLPAGSGYVRVLLPYRSEAVCRDWEVSQLLTPKLPPLGPGDTVLVQREAGIIGSGEIPGWIDAIRQAGARLVYEIDDDLLDGAALKERGFRGDATDLASRVLAFARAADCVTVSSDALLAKFTPLNRATVLVSNALDPHLWQLMGDLPPHLSAGHADRPGERLVIGYVGTPTHGGDLAVVRSAIRELEKRFPGRIDVQIIGGFGSGEKTFGTVVALPKANDYPSFVRWLRNSVRWDIGLVPLADNAFNNFKSYLKYVELAALGMAVVCSDGPEYAKVVQDGQTGIIIPNDKGAWVAALTKLVTDPEERRRLAVNSYQDVRARHTFNQLAPSLLRVVTASAS